jgi:hypothetical protein
MSKKGLLPQGKSTVLGFFDKPTISIVANNFAPKTQGLNR